MTIRAIQNDTDHAAAMARMRELWDAEPGSDGFHELDALAAVVNAYEAKKYPVPPADPITTGARIMPLP